MYQQGDTPILHQERSSCTWDPPRPCSVYLFIFFNELIYVSIFLRAVSHISKEIKGEKEVMGTFD